MHPRTGRGLQRRCLQLRCSIVVLLNKNLVIPFMSWIKTIQCSFWFQRVDRCSSVVVVLSYFFYNIFFLQKLGGFIIFCFFVFCILCVCLYCGLCCETSILASYICRWDNSEAWNDPKNVKKIPVTLWNLSSIIKAILRHCLRLLFWTARAQVFTVPVHILKISLMMLRLKFFFFFFAHFTCFCFAEGLHSGAVGSAYQYRKKEFLAEFTAEAPQGFLALNATSYLYWEVASW